MERDIIIYSTHCPKCNVLIKKLQQANIKFTLIDDEEGVMKKASELNVTFAPFILVNNRLYDFSYMMNYIKNS